jgi:hypothetical protein
MRIKKTVRIPEFQGQKFVMTGIEVLGINKDTVILTGDDINFKLTLKNLNNTNGEDITVTLDSDDNENEEGVYKFMLDQPTSLPYIRYIIETTSVEVRAVNLLGFVTELSF